MKTKRIAQIQTVPMGTRIGYSRRGKAVVVNFVSVTVESKHADISRAFLEFTAEIITPKGKTKSVGPDYFTANSLRELIPGQELGRALVITNTTKTKVVRFTV